jgi:hypothetical protein
MSIWQTLMTERFQIQGMPSIAFKQSSRKVWAFPEKAVLHVPPPK